ncbi:MAG: type II toxin-antitoxin system VapC family toxin [Nitrospirae bacterium]|nr:type II toxin-antitoxin system VapC family toxin [Nitrospirota bacterium]
MKYLLDTNICIYIIRKKPERVLRRLQRKRISEVGISSITLSELEYGVAKSLKSEQNKLALTEFLAPIEVLSYNDMAARRYGGLRADLERQGTPLGSLDMLIAAHALSLGSVLVTNNESEFRRVPGLKVENWTK